MIKTIVVPKSNHYQLEIPTHYIGKKIEILINTIDEIDKVQKNDKKEKLSSKYRGVLTQKQGEELDKHINIIRNEWNNI